MVKNSTININNVNYDCYVELPFQYDGDVQGKMVEDINTGAIHKNVFMTPARPKFKTNFTFKLSDFYNNVSNFEYYTWTINFLDGNSIIIVPYSIKQVLIAKKGDAYTTLEVGFYVL